MLFWIFVIILVVAIVGLVIYDNSNYYSEVFPVIMTFMCGLSGLIVLVMGLCLIFTYADLDYDIAALNAEYESLTYQYENDMYENDNDIGKKELMDGIRAWNTKISGKQARQYDFWVGIFTPNIYDQFELIEYKEVAPNEP